MEKISSTWYKDSLKNLQLPSHLLVKDNAISSKTEKKTTYYMIAFV